MIQKLSRAKVSINQVVICMNKKELIEAIAKKNGVSNKQAGHYLDATVEAIADALADKQDVVVSGFGTFSLTERKERKGRNPKTGEEITIKGGNSVRFKPFTALKSAVN